LHKLILTEKLFQIVYILSKKNAYEETYYQIFWLYTSILQALVFVFQLRD